MPKEKLSWSELMTQLVNSDNAETTIKTGRAIAKAAGSEHVRDLYSLLQSSNFFVRETAAVPLARLEGLKVLPDLFKALQQGELDGHDNDSLTGTIIGLLESNKKKATPLLLDMLKSPDSGIRADAVWALGFVVSQVEPAVFMEIIRTEKDPEVRSMAADALQGFLDTKRKYAVDTKKFLGRWMWLDTTEQLKYGFDLKGTEAICTRTNAPACYGVGDVMLKIQLASDPVFVGKQIFNNGAWYAITAIRDGDKLHMQGVNVNWTMERVK